MDEDEFVSAITQSVISDLQLYCKGERLLHYSLYAASNRYVGGVRRPQVYRFRRQVTTIPFINLEFRDDSVFVDLIDARYTKGHDYDFSIEYANPNFMEILQSKAQEFLDGHTD